MSRRGVGFAVLLTLLVLFTGAAGMEFFENTAALRDAGVSGVTELDSYGESLWWAAMVLTTMGTDYWPRTAEGRVLCGLLALYAFAVFGYITATVASYFLGRDRSAESEPPAAGEPLAELRALRADIVALRSEVARLGRGESRSLDGAPADALPGA